jgi:hypothetical protein
MKKLIVFTLIISCFLLFAQGQFGSFCEQFYILGTAKDTSRTFQIWPYMTLWHSVCDTAAGGSASAVRWDLQISPDSSNQLFENQWVTVKTDSIKTDSLWSYTNLTTSALPIGIYGRLILTGLAANNAVTPTLTSMHLEGFNMSWR